MNSPKSNIDMLPRSLLTCTRCNEEQFINTLGIKPGSATWTMFHNQSNSLALIRLQNTDSLKSISLRTIYGVFS